MITPSAVGCKRWLDRVPECNEAWSSANRVWSDESGRDAFTGAAQAQLLRAVSTPEPPQLVHLISSTTVYDADLLENAPVKKLTTGTRVGQQHGNSLTILSGL